MRVVYFGSGAFSVPSLQAVLATRHEVVGVFTQPARPAGRKGGVRPTPIAQAARQGGREAVECADINAAEVADHIRRLKGDVICVVDFGQMIRRNVLDCAPHGAFNLHGSLLPALRGAAPVNWALIRGHKRTGVTTFRVVEEMDAGAVYLQSATDIGPDETGGELKVRLAEMGARTVCETLDLIETGRAELTEQDHSKATLAPRMKKSDGIIDWASDAAAVCNLIRGTWPWPGARTVLRRGGDREIALAIALAREAPGAAAGEPGTLDDELCVSTGKGRVRIVRLQPAGKRLMEWPDFVNGYRPQPGDRCCGAERG
ncbi:MAG: methionyl-tRNA formyltransferase [Phycisphaerae bacterium]